jgi:hypothetical protein
MERKMIHKRFITTIIYCLAALMLVVNSSGVAASPAEHGNIFTVSPNGVDDTANILQAFADAQASGPGATVQFTAGTFITDLINVVNFHGFVKGMGQDKTIITPRANLSCQAAIDQGYLPSLFRFSEGSIKVSALTLNFPVDQCPPYTFSWWNGELTTWLYAGFTFTGPAPVNMTECGYLNRGKVDAAVDRVSVIAREGASVVAEVIGGGEFVTQDSCSGYGYNTDTTLKVTRSYFENGMMGGPVVANVDGGGIIIKGNTIKGGGFGMWVADVANAVVLVSDNILENPVWNGINLLQGAYAEIMVPAAPAQFIVRNNTIKIKDEYVWGILLVDNTPFLGENETPRMNVLLEGNQVIQNGPTTIGLVGMGVHNALVLNNRFSGQGETAIANGYPSSYGDFPSVGWFIRGNDLRSLQPYPPATSMNKIVLGELSRDCRVVTGSTDDVLDLGTDNVVIGGRLRSGRAPALHLLHKMLKHLHK